MVNTIDGINQRKREYKKAEQNTFKRKMVILTGEHRKKGQTINQPVLYHTLCSCTRHLSFLIYKMKELDQIQTVPLGSKMLTFSVVLVICK